MTKRRIVVYMLVLLTLLAGVASAEHILRNKDVGRQNNVDHGGTNALKKQVSNLLPKSLDEQYKGSVPGTMSSPYLFEMLKMAGFFEGITVNVQEGDIANAKISFKQFSDEYNKISTLVPEWKRYFKPSLVAKLGEDLNSGNIAVDNGNIAVDNIGNIAVDNTGNVAVDNIAVDTVMQDIGNIGVSCNRCHVNVMPQVQAKYYWKDFNKVNVNTPMGNMAWTDAMEVTATGFDGVRVNLEEGKRTEAYNSWQLYKTMLYNLKDACNNCHDTPRYYYVSNDSLAKVDQMGADIAGNVAVDAIVLEQQQLGEDCYKCHLIHQPAQIMKDKQK